MRFTFTLSCLIFLLILNGCNISHRSRSAYVPKKGIHGSRGSDHSPGTPSRVDSELNEKIVAYAESLLGTKYKYGGNSPEEGFDCSGLVHYVFKNFSIPVPRISKDFVTIGEEIPLAKAKRGDVILFTGTDTTGWQVGHLGIVTENENQNFKFIHSSSGRSVGVIISNLGSYYKTRFVKLVRIGKAR